MHKAEEEEKEEGNENGDISLEISTALCQTGVLVVMPLTKPHSRGTSSSYREETLCSANCKTQGSTDVNDNLLHVVSHFMYLDTSRLRYKQWATDCK